MAKMPDQRTDDENADTALNPNMSGNAPTSPITQRTSQAFRRDYTNSQVIGPDEAVDTCDNDRYAYYGLSEGVRRP